MNHRSYMKIAAFCLLAVLFPHLFLGLAAALSVGYLFSSREKPQVRTFDPERLQARVAAQYDSSNPLVRAHAREVARCLLGLNRSCFRRLSDDQVVGLLKPIKPRRPGCDR